MKQRFTIDVSGDLAGVITLPKQIEFAGAKTMTDLAKRSQTVIIDRFKTEADFHTRGDWYLPSRRHGIRIQTATRAKPEAIVYSMADWLLESEGYNQGVKKPDGGGKNLAIPDTEHTRHGIKNTVQRAEKARKLLDNAGRSKAFKIKSRTGAELILQRIGLDSTGKPLVGKKGNYLRGRGKKVASDVVLKYILQKRVKVPYNPVITKWTVITTRLHLPSYFNENLLKAIKTARLK